MDDVPESPVVLTIEYVAEDFVRAARWTALRSARPYGYFVAVFVVSGLVLWLGIRSDDFNLIVAAVAAGVLGTLIGFPYLLFLFGAQARAVFNSTHMLHYPVQWSLTSRELRIVGKGIDSKLELTNYVKATETPDALLLWQSSGVYNCLPKRVITDRETLQRARDMIRQGLPGTAKIQLRND